MLQHYGRIHNAVPGIEKTNFPHMRFTDQQIIGMARNVNSGKGLAYDGMSDKLFQLRKDCRKEEEPCLMCRKKIELLRRYLNPRYWNEENTGKHMTGRLVAFNKRFPKIPTIEEYRPIIVMSPLIKFIEGRLVGRLRSYGKTRLNKAQFGFVSRLSV